jgi:hypothetical protein
VKRSTKEKTEGRRRRRVKGCIIKHPGCVDKTSRTETIRQPLYSHQWDKKQAQTDAAWQNTKKQQEKGSAFSVVERTVAKHGTSALQIAHRLAKQNERRKGKRL